MIDNRFLLKKLVRIAVPIAIQGSVAATLNLVDNLMVGSLGEAELAAVGIGSQIYFIHYLFLFGFNSGTSTFLAQFYGKGDFANIRKSTGFAMTVAMGISLIFFVGTLLFPETLLTISIRSLVRSNHSSAYLLFPTHIPIILSLTTTRLITGQVLIPGTAG